MFRIERQGAVSVVTCGGPITHDTLGGFRQALSGCLSRGQPRLVLDFSGASHFDGEGLEALLEGYEAAVASGGAVCLASLSPLCRDILRTTGVGDRFEEYPSVRQAVGSFAR